MTADLDAAIDRIAKIPAYGDDEMESFGIGESWDELVSEFRTLVERLSRFASVETSGARTVVTWTGNLATVCAGRPQKGMPSWCALGLDMSKINDIYEYVKGRGDAKISPVFVGYGRIPGSSQD